MQTNRFPRVRASARCKKGRYRAEDRFGRAEVHGVPHRMSVVGCRESVKSSLVHPDAF